MHTLNYIAILGFAKEIDENQATLAKVAAEKISDLGFGVSVGSISGTCDCALRSAKRNGGITKAIVEQNLENKQHHDCDILQVVATQDEKHSALADQCSGALVIGGGHGTLKLINRFLKQRKKIAALEGSGGIVPNELDSRVVLSNSIESALKVLVS